MNATLLAIRLTVVINCLIIGCATVGCQPKPSFQRIEFEYANYTDDAIWVDSLIVAGKVADDARLWANDRRRNSVSLNRHELSPASLLETPAEFKWWKISDPMDVAKARKGPALGFLRQTDSVPFPRFDPAAKKWKCLYSLQKNKTWVGRFDGVVLKTPGAASEKVNSSGAPDNDSWIQFQFRNLTDKAVSFLDETTVIKQSNLEIPLFLPDLPADGKYYGFTANCHEGSIYRPTGNAQAQLTWKSAKGPFVTQAIAVPVLKPRQKNRFCYFTLVPGGKWVAVFEN